MNELRSRSDSDLMQVATSKNYGKSTRKAARAILEERGVKIDDQTFSNPSQGNVPTAPADTGGRAFLSLGRILIGLALMALAAYLRVRWRTH